MKSNKAFMLLGVLFAVVLLISSVVADEAHQNEAKVEKAKESHERVGNEEMKAVLANLCEKQSVTWSGTCSETEPCNKRCQNWEGARHGSCQARNGWKCFCYFDC